ncbi:hypothetical protein TrVE_jg13582 [Triparma verrucosa]|uniref:Uncharacterized protein n=1 Tax=Triparma verrucosa TaxID=1606542 RepID=A0A9W7BXM2_9STRA|nr:hypothetical protein TrVE_jg13582 [Triparma verrucosa]
MFAVLVTVYFLPHNDLTVDGFSFSALKTRHKRPITSPITTTTKLHDSNSGGFFAKFVNEIQEKSTEQTKSNLPPHPSYSRDYQPNKSVINIPSSPLPSHTTTVSNTLPNGFSYCILPNASPSGRFEAHLQVFTGSSSELQHQQGLAHLTEHVAYMGSRKRERLFGTGSQTNAYTDFHHTVFYASCPVDIPDGQGYTNSVFNGGNAGKGKMVGLAFDALAEVMEASCEDSRLEKERQAVLSEMTMVNTIEYRVECQILSTLHRENRLAKRFPIGKEDLIKSWTREDVVEFHRTHYRPDNVLLYVVGDVDIPDVERYIREKFGGLSAEKHGAELKEDQREKAESFAREVTRTVKSEQSWHFPPTVHEWSEKGERCRDESESSYDLHLQNRYDMDDETLNNLPEVSLPTGGAIRPHVFKHELLQSFSLHLFAKRRIRPIVTVEDFVASIARRIVLAAMQIRLNVSARGESPPFTFVEFNQLDSAREGCAVCSLDLMAEPARWREAVELAVGEIKRLGLYGLTISEVERYGGACLTDAAQVAAQGDRISHSDQLGYLMETVSCGHAFMSPEQSYIQTEKALQSLTLEQVNEEARILCEHIVGLADGEEPIGGPVVAIGCGPKDNASADPCDKDALIDTLVKAANREVYPEEDIIVPRSLVSEEDLNASIEVQKPEWRSGSFTDGTPDTPADKVTTPLTLRRLSNGIRVGVTASDAESQRGHLRLVAPGGRMGEKRLGFAPGAAALGARTMQEGGAFGCWTREQVELFCVDHLLMVEINCNDEFITLDFVFPTTEVGNIGYGDELKAGINGCEAVLQVVREIVRGFKWEADALGRAKASFHSTYDGLYKNLEGMSAEKIIGEMTGGDQSFVSVGHEEIDAVTLDEAKHAVMSQLLPSEIEVSMVGDFDTKEALDLVLKYLGTIPADANEEFLAKAPNADQAVRSGSGAVAPTYTVPPLPLPARQLDFELEDPDPRAIAYVSGAAPNSWGFLAGGGNLADQIQSSDKNPSTFDGQRRGHPLFARCALLLISEIVNRRLFSNVREKRQLTYDANFKFTGYEQIGGGFFLCTVTASKEKAQEAMEACKETLEALVSSQPISNDNLESAKRVVVNRHEGEMRTTRYLSELMSGLQLDAVPKKGPLSLTDFNAMVQAITVKDLQLALAALDVTNNLYTAIGKTILPKDYVEGKDGSPALTRGPVGGTRGGPLTG